MNPIKLTDDDDKQDFNYAKPVYIDRAIDNLGAAEMDLKMYRQEHGLSKEK